MKNLSLTFCLVITVLLASVEGGFASDLPPCPSSGVFHNCFGTLSFEDGDKYVGEWSDDKYQGLGTYNYSSGDKYVGEYKDDKKNGFGVYFFGGSHDYSGDRFFGIYKNALEITGLYVKRNGRAKFIKNWELCDNCITDNAHNVLPVLKRAFNLLDKKNRQTIQKNLKKIGMYHSTVDGLWGRGTLNAIAEFAVLRMKTIKFNSREVSERIINTILAGELSPTLKIESTPVPVAKAPTQDDEIISTSDLPSCPSSGVFHNCFGTYTFEGGQKYIGEWKDDKTNGQGIRTYPSGNKYVGEYKDGKKHGQGTATFASGNKYVGEYKDGKKTGQGTYTYANGDKYVGEWKDDKRNGQGTYTFADGDKYVGEWKDGNSHGRGTYTYPDGRKYVGEYKDDKRNGQGTYTYADGTVKEGIWKDGDFQYAKKLSPTVPIAKTPTQDDEIISASSGSGFAVSSDGYVITNHHVIEGCQKVVVHTKEKDLTVRVITYDPQNDLALLKGDFRPSTVFPLSSNRPELLQDIYVAGYPFGNKISTSVKVTRGIISSLTGIGNNFSNIQIDAALQPGNSGGPIIDEMGNIVGVAVAKLDIKKILDDYGVIPEDTNFGIKSNVVRSILDSNEVDGPPANQSEISKSKLGKMISNGTYYISCWMTMAQIEKMKTKKAFFSNLD